ncbi:sensor histidine kinase [Chryseolinea lacunae]|uniref:histidine kinase n=1 Tax=Chryseolinea lacunae TaxID=2801331 RepID=A0ABS1L2M6_9BACT|nr:PAS domain-containing sensor histidine kinase [Chryseolinea lacunae]MBL0745820.1 PAS domain-containing sensor histidine kinase [Chryseolinea lacunae]
MFIIMHEMTYTFANLVANKVDAMLAYWDRDLVCRYANDAYLTWFGVTKELMVNKMTLPDLLGEALFEKNLPYILGALRGADQMFEREIPLPNKKGTRHSLAKYFPHVVSGEVLGIIIHVADVSLLKELETQILLSKETIEKQALELEIKNGELLKVNDELQATIMELRASNEYLDRSYRVIDDQANQLRDALEVERDLAKLKNTFVSVVSHEFRTPVFAISLIADVLSRNIDRLDSNQISEKIASIKMNLACLDRLIDDVLYLGKVDANKVSFKPVPIPFGTIKNQVNDVFQVLGQKHTLQITSSGPDDQSIFMDKDLSKIIIDNLVGNALKYSPENSIIQVDITLSNSRLMLKITDQGIGIPEADLPDLFQTFFRAKNVGSIKGSGLGLYIVKDAVGRLKGEIHVSSEEGKGSVFTVILPV